MQDSKEQRVHGVFEKIYKNYDQMNSVISFQQHKKWRDKTMRIMNVKEGAKALDVCCGTADWTIALAKAAGKSGEIKGLDFSENMLSVGEQKVKDGGFSQIELLHGNAMELPFDDDTFDYVTIGFGLRNVPDYLTVLKEMRRVVKPGGRWYVWKRPSRKCSDSDRLTLCTLSILCRFSGNCLRRAIKNILGFKNQPEISLE